MFSPSKQKQGGEKQIEAVKDTFILDFDLLRGI